TVRPICCDPLTAATTMAAAAVYAAIRRGSAARRARVLTSRTHCAHGDVEQDPLQGARVHALTSREADAGRTGRCMWRAFYCGPAGPRTNRRARSTDVVA